MEATWAGGEDELFKKIMDEPEFGSLVKKFLLRKVYERLASGDAPASAGASA